MEVKTINKQNFTAAYACINGEWYNLARGAKKVSIKAVRKSIKDHALDYFSKYYKTDKNKNVYYTKNKEFNAALKKLTGNSLSKNKQIAFIDIFNNKDIYVNYHRINSNAKELSDLYLILTGKEAMQLSQGTKKEKGQFIRSLFKKSNININNRNTILYNCATIYPEASKNFNKKHGLTWYELARANSIIKCAKKDAEITRKMIETTA